MVSVDTWTDLQGVLGRSVVMACLETQLSGRRSREAELGFLCRKIKAPLVVFSEMFLLSPAGKYKVRQTRVSLCSWECGIGGKCSDSLGTTETWNRGFLCRAEKLHLEKIKTRLLALKTEKLS